MNHDEMQKAMYEVFGQISNAIGDLAILRDEIPRLKSHKIKQQDAEIGRLVSDNSSLCRRIAELEAKDPNIERVVAFHDKPAPEKIDLFPKWKELDMSLVLMQEAINPEFSSEPIAQLLRGFLGDDATDNFDSNLLLAVEKLAPCEGRSKRRILYQVADNGWAGHWRYWDQINGWVHADSFPHAVICAVYTIYTSHKNGERFNGKS